MSLRNQPSDTSRVVKNPLLSAVPHSIDDFVNNTILLPAAEIPPVVAETLDTEENKDGKKSVIYGSEPTILDSDRFSEISLDQTADSEPTYSAPQQAYNPLQNLEPFIAEPENRDESTFNPIAQATAIKDSLSQLPGVASSVLSSFSNILKGTSPSPQPSTPRNEPNLDSFVSAPAANPYQYPYYNYDQSSQPVEAPIGPPPTFYSPTDSAILQSPSAQPPTDALPSNTYRLKERKKVAYAPIPGFSGNLVQPPSSVSPAPPAVTPQASIADPTVTKSNSSFSLTSFFSSPLIDKIQNTVLPPSRPPVEQQSLYQDTNPIDISVQQSQPPPVASNYQTPAQFFNPQAFNTTPFASKTNALQPSITNTFEASSPAPATPQFFNPNVHTFTPVASTLSNFPEAHPSFPPQAANQPIGQAFLPPTASHLPPSSSTPASSRASQSPAPLLPSTPSIPSANTPVPGPPPAVSSSLPPSATSLGYRLKGKPLYRKPPSETSFNTIPSQIQLLPQPRVNTFTAEPAVAPLSQGVNIFNPFASNTADLVDQSAPVQPPAPSSFYTPQVASQISVFSVNRSETTLQSPQPSAPIVTSTPRASPQPANSTTVPPIPQSNPFASVNEPSASIPTVLPPPPTLSASSSHNQYRIPSAAPSPYTAPNSSQINFFNPAAQQSEPSGPSQQVGPIGVTPPPTVSSNPSDPVTTSVDPHSTAPSAPQPFYTPAPIPLNSPADTSPFGAFVEPQPRPSSTQSAQFPINSFFALPPTSDVKPYPAKTPSPALSTDTSRPSQPQQQNENPIFNSFESNAVQPQDYFNPFRNQPLNTVVDAVSTLSLDTDNNIISTVDEPTEAIEQDQSDSRVIDPSSFFNNNFAEDEPTSSTSNNSNEFQIQNFFNNPPPLSDTQEVVQDKNFNFIGTNLLNKRIEKIASAAVKAETDTSETLSLASYIVEPASSVQSEFSEYAEPPSSDINNRSVDTTCSTTAADIQDQQDQVDSKNIFDFLSKQTDDEMPNATIGELGTSVTTAATNIVYRPVYKHWFHTKISETKTIWIPFSFNDSMRLEEAFTVGAPDAVITDGGRCDVNIPERKRTAVYWKSEETEVRRCSWFYRGKDSRYKPYDEEVAEHLEDEYRDASNTGEWQRKIPLKSGETVVFHGPSTMVHFLQSQSPDSWTQNAQSGGAIRPRTVKRGIDEFSIDDGEPEQVDHLLFMVHGIGAACDLKFRTIQEVVDDFRANAMQLVQSHYRNSCDKGEVGRVEVLPISWHSELHSKDTGIDEKLKAITLESIPKLRNFTNCTLLDILFYTSPVFCQQIMNAVADNMNNIYTAFRKRNPSFRGSVSVCGHSLGSLILFDLLQHQKPPKQTTSKDDVENSETPDNGSNSATRPPLQRTMSQQVNYTIGHAGTGQAYIAYPKLEFQPKMFFALGSPIGMFVTVRGLDSLGLDFKMPTTDHFFNIFHPFDPVAYRIEALINPELASLRPVLIPHHKGRKRMHLELRETMARFGADIKNKISETFKATLNTVFNYATLNKNARDTKAIQQEVDKVIEEQLALEPDALGDLPASATSFTSSESDNGETDLPLGKINGGRRIDHVLQEAPMEYFNEYIFALSSHVCYWDSSDTTLFIMKEIYSSHGIRADTKVPQQTMTIERPTTSGLNSPTS